MARRPNSRPPTPPGLVLHLTDEEIALLRRNRTRGGYQDAENFILSAIEPGGRLALNPRWQSRLQHYCQGSDTGGPNSRIRAALTPAFARAGVALSPRSPPPPLSGGEGAATPHQPSLFEWNRALA